MEGGLCDQLLQSTEDGVWQGADGCVGDVPADTNTNKWVFNRGVSVAVI